jgi:mannose-1-phosphate guanylyltransferase
MTEAVLLVGGQGTRLRPLTEHTPKPMLAVAGIPVTEHQIARAREAGVTRVILGTSYRAEVFRDHFGDGEALGVELVYATEDEPLGTGGAIAHVAPLLRSGADDPVLVFNGDVLSGVDLKSLVQTHVDVDADVTLYLTRVADPRPFGLVPTDESSRVLDFLEKPQTPEEIVTDQINAGCYVFRRSVIDTIPTGRPVSVEREIFPALLSSGASVFGVVDDGYWLDLGTPLSYVRGSCDLVLGTAPSPLLIGRTGDSLVLDGAWVHGSAVLTGGSCVGRDARIESGAVVDGSVVMDGAVVGEGARLRNCVVGNRAVVEPGAVMSGVILADSASVGARA